MALHIEILRETAAIRSLTQEWGNLLSHSHCNRAFSHPIWYLTALALQPELKPLLLASFRNGRLTGILPLAVHGDSACFASGLADFNDAVVAKGDVESASALLERAMMAEQYCARLNLRRLRPDADLIAALVALTGDFVFQNHIPPNGHCLIAENHDGFEAYLATRKAHHRARIRQMMRQAARAGLEAVELEPSHLAPEQLPHLFLNLHLRRLRDRSVFHHPSNQTFVARALPALFACGALRVFALRQGSDTIALKIFTTSHNSLGEWNGGFHPQWKHRSPGHLLTLAGIRKAFAMNLAEYDMLRGVEPHKHQWATARRPYAQVSLPVVKTPRLAFV